ncbi:MAG TPA: PEP-CTERM sorting domain-containing protein [Casimicrobiaceae bacterium]|nr:PEP-CTERM sorting domain-containing protein [Casimicrobiaceae bacterium]
MKAIWTTVSVMALMAASQAASAVSCLDIPQGCGISTIPEPGTLELLSLGGIVAAVIAVRNRRKK